MINIISSENFQKSKEFVDSFIEKNKISKNGDVQEIVQQLINVPLNDKSTIEDLDFARDLVTKLSETLILKKLVKNCLWSLAFFISTLIIINGVLFLFKKEAFEIFNDFNLLISLPIIILLFGLIFPKWFASGVQNHNKHKFNNNEFIYYQKRSVEDREDLFNKVEYVSFMKEYVNDDWDRDTPFLDIIETEQNIFFSRSKHNKVYPLKSKISELDLTEEERNTLKTVFKNDYDLINDLNLGKFLMNISWLKSYKKNEAMTDDYFNWVFKVL